MKSTPQNLGSPKSSRLQSPQVDGKLAIREQEAAILVVRADDPDDWLVRFDKEGGFPAREWAENMVGTWTNRLLASGRLSDQEAAQILEAEQKSDNKKGSLCDSSKDESRHTIELQRRNDARYRCNT